MNSTNLLYNSKTIYPMYYKKQKMKDIFSIKNKVIVITGGGKGIGQDLAINMTNRGAYVYAVDIKFQNIMHLSLIHI